MGDLYDRKVYIRVMDRFRVRMMDGMRRQVMGLLAWVVGGRRRVSWLVMLLWWVKLLWWRMRRRCSCGLVRDPRSETGVVLKTAVRVR